MSDKDKKILDSDADGLTDQEEEKLGTNPLDPDSDHDGLGDYQEVKVYGTDPLNPDTDHDSISDGEEVKMGRNPKGQGNLKDLFVPSHRNDYRPHALHPKRLAFHAASAVAIKVLMVIFALSFPAQAWLSPDILTEQANKIISLTNNIRTNLNLAPLRKNNILTEAALNKAQDMIINQYFAHVGPDNKSLRNWLYSAGYNFQVAGENLAMGFSGADQVVNAWTNSETHYANIIDPDFTEIGVAAVSGDYKGYETTLIAQYFGTPQNVPIEPAVPVVPSSVYDAKIEQASTEPAPEPVEEPQSEPVVTNEPEPDNTEIVPIEDNQEVLGDDTTQAEPVNLLSTPILISPENNQILNKDLNIFKISAKEAKSISILDNGNLLVSKPVENGNLEIALRLDQGQHRLSFVAKAGDQEKKSNDYLLTVDTIAPVIDHQKTEILVNRPDGQNDIVVKATVYVSEDTDNVTVDFADQSIILQRDLTETGKWVGNKILTDVDYNKYFNPVVLATISASDKAGNKITQDSQWQEIKPVVGSTVSRYIFVKEHPSEFIKPLFSLGSIYYKILIAILLISILLTIFVEFREQRPKTIASALAVVALLVCLTIF